MLDSFKLKLLDPVGGSANKSVSLPFYVEEDKWKIALLHLPFGHDEVFWDVFRESSRKKFVQLFMSFYIHFKFSSCFLS